jgi:hypothetical protein
MLRDVFYYGQKPNVHPREQFAKDLEDARNKATTRDFWIINEFCDYRNFNWDFDFEFLPDEDVWAEDHNNVWPSQHQKDSGTWLCPKQHSDLIIYRCDVDPIWRKNEKQSVNWVELDLIDHTKFDFSWHPDPTDPPYIYKWGCKYYPAQIKHVLEYRVPGSTQEKFMDISAELLPDWDKWVIPDSINKSGFDFSWRPSPLDPPLIYEFGTQWQKDGGPIYVASGATKRKYINDQKATRIASNENWTIPDNIDIAGFDLSWHPDNISPPYIYVFATQWALSGGPVYTVPGATEIKYVDAQVATALPDKTNWIYNEEEIDVSSFDFSWHPFSGDDPFIYQFGTQWQKTGGPKYITPGADESSPIKYVDTRIIKATHLPDKNKFIVLGNNAVQEFDYSWHPDDTEDPYIYVFGNQWHTAEVMPTIEYRMTGATQYKYINDTIAILGPNMTHWFYDSNEIDVSDFDFSWCPNPGEPELIYEFATQWQKTGGPRYIVPGATDVKYLDFQKARALPSEKNWTVPSNIDATLFDFSWHPDATSPPYIYVFATQWALSGGPIYTVPNATEYKYVDEQIATALPDMTNWVYDETKIDVESFDFSWHPYVEDQPYIYQFGTQWWPTGGPKYIAPGATSASPVKYIDTRIIKANTIPGLENWEIPDEVDKSKFDFTWIPHPEDPPYIYVFGNQWFSAEKMPTVRYIVEGATEIKYVRDIIATIKPNKDNWTIANNIVVKEFDFSWIPDPHSPPYIYVFGNQWYSAEEMSTVEYHTLGATERKYINDIRVVLDKNFTNWEIPKGIDVSRFDFSWIPHPKAPPYIYQFGTLKDPLDGPRYITPGNNGEIVRVPRIELDEIEFMPINRYYIETTLDDLIIKHPDEMFWALNKEIDYSTFNFDWTPSLDQADYIQVFGQSSSIKTQTYLINSTLWTKGLREFNYVEEQEKKTVSDLDIFFVDKGNSEANERFHILKNKFGSKIQKTRYLNSWVDTINRCINRATSNLIWILNSELDYSNFDFTYYPNPWQMKMVHVFGTQHSHWGTTFMVNRETFPEDTKYIKIIEHLSNLNFVKDIRAKATECVYDIVIIDHNNIESLSVTETMKRVWAPNRNVTTIKYEDSYLNTIRNYVKKLPDKKEHYLWICSSVCDYTNFDFSYICDPFAKDNLHVFPSNNQKFGDTFLLDVNKTKEIIDDLEKLEDYNKVSYNSATKANRLLPPIIVTENDTHTNSLETITGFPYARLITKDNLNVEVPEIEPMNLWSPETKNIQVLSTGATHIVAPIEIKDYVKKELYEYPYIKRAPKLALSNPIDIVFLSNGEIGAEENYEHLLNITKNLKNRVVRVDGVNGRVAAYHKAAEASETPWFFTVFAKLKVSPKFDFNWQPDRMQIPKHYIFHAKNPVNGLTYGHQAMIAYNKKLTLANEGYGLDFTLDDEHEVVPLISGTAHYNTDEFSTWRTAFREVIKLKADISDIAKDRLDVWLNKAEGDFAQYSIKGALDADEYYDEVNGEFDKLKLSYEWDWLRKKFGEM